MARHQNPESALPGPGKPFPEVRGGVLAARGFRAAGVCCGIKSERGRKDLAVLIADAPAVAAATFTTNKVRASGVRWCEKVIRRRRPIRAVVINSGNANACTGVRGEADTEAMASTLAELEACSPGEVLVSSTGIIGEYLPMGKVTRGIAKAHGAAKAGVSAGGRFADAMQTTDLVRKEIAVRVESDAGTFTIGGCAKGSGMIGPKMATMLAYLTTDAAVEEPTLRRLLKRSVDQSFNAISVDGHASTNDTVLLLASGASGVRIDDAQSRRLFGQALGFVSRELAKSVVRDGEGATKLVQIDVTGAETTADARLVAHTMARSPLNQTAIHGCDPNWGRFISSAGYSGAKMVEGKARLTINGVPTFTDGLPADTPAELLTAEMQGKEIRLHLDLRIGSGKATVWTCDLSKEYIAINADYHT